MLTEPHWLLLLLPLLWLIFTYRPDSRKILYLRIVLIILLCLALAGPVIKVPGRDGVILVLADKSASMPSNQDKRINETMTLLREKMPENAQLGLVSFSDRAKIELTPSRGDVSGLSTEQGIDSSNMAEGIDLALSLIPEDSSGRIILVSDGLWNGNSPQSSAMNALKRGIPIDYRYIGQESSNDLAVININVPPVLEPEEAFILRANILSPAEQQAEISLYANNKEIFKTTKTLRSGENEVSFSLKAPSASIVRYSLKVTGEDSEVIPENNRAYAVTMIRGKKPVLVVSAEEKSVIKSFLDLNRIKSVLVKPNHSDWNIEELMNYSAVVLENVSADALGYNGMHCLEAWVKHLGGGLLITGGHNSYGNGGYYQSPLEEALPVTLEMHGDKRKMSIAIAVVLDRSGSMSAMSSGRTKMELADLAAASTLDLLSPIDEYCLFAVDTEPHCIVPLQYVKNKDRYREDILRVRSQGGGIYVYDGIKAAVNMLKTSNAKTRHIILFSDACDSEKPGEYWDLLDDARKYDMTLSVVGLGKESDVDANILKKIAECGGGRCFFTSMAEELPRLFSQDTFIVAKNTFIKEKTKITSSSSLDGFMNKSYGFSSELEAYNLLYLKDTASQLITVNNDENTAGLAVWKYGLGKVACFAGVLDGVWGGEFVKSDVAANVLSSVCNWMAFDDRNFLEDTVITQKVENGKWTAKINLDPERVRDPFDATPEFQLICSDGVNLPKHLTVKANWDSADELSISYDLKGNEVVSALLCLDNKKQLRLSPACQIYSPEYKPHGDRNGAEELRELCAITGGREIMNLGSVWENMPPVMQNKDISDILFSLALVVFLLEIAERRTAILTMLLVSIKKLGSIKVNTVEKPSDSVEDTYEADDKVLKTVVTNAPAAKPVEKTEEKPVEKSKNVLSALKAAKQKAGRRTGND